MAFVKYEPVESGIVRVKLNRPERLNAFSPAVESELLECVQRAVSDPEVRVVVMSGEGRAFSAGWDLKEGASSHPNDRPLAHRAGQNTWLEIIRLLRRPDKLFIAAVHGYAAGQGLELCIASDFIVAAESSRFYFAETRVGFNMTSGVAHFLPLLVGMGHARRLALLGQTIDGREAERLGLAIQTVVEEELDGTVFALAREALRGAPLAFAAQKSLLDMGTEAALYDVQIAEVQASERLLLSEDAREAQQAFVEKREPQFEGR